MLKEAKKVPAIRFSGFTDSWEQRKLNEVLDLLKDGTHGTHQDADEGPLLLSAKNIKNGEIVWDDSDRRISIEEYKSIHSNFQLQPDDILLTIVGSIGETAILRNPQGLTFQRSVAFLRPDKHINSEFMCSEIQSTRFQNELRKRKSTSAQPGIYLGDLQEIPFIFPANPDEQRNISSCFCNLDNLIALHQRKLNQQKKLKKYFLQNMFPAKGEKVPRIRFKGFTGDWEQRKLGDIAKFINGRAYAQNELLPSGKYKVLRVGNFYTNNSWYYSDLELDDKYYANDGDLLYTWSATFGPHIWRGDRVIYHYHIWKIDLTDKLEKRFAVQLLEQDKNDILSGHNGSTMVHITKKGMEQKKVIIPKSIWEQRQLGLFFDNLDNLITLHQRKLNQLLTMKKFMLQNLFI